MSDALIQETTVTPTFVLIKFLKTLKVSEIHNSNFVVKNTDTDTVVSGPFNAIDVLRDYDSIARELSLYWVNAKLIVDTNYSVTVTGLYDSLSNLLEDAVITFTTGSDVSQDPQVIEAHTPVITIEDFSVISTGIIGSEIFSPPVFKVLSTDPDKDQYFLEADYNNGRVAIKFSDVPQDKFINSQYFKVQRKPVQRKPARWESITTQITKDGTKPWVYIDFPALTDDSVFNTSGYDYFKENYKYRIITSKDVGSSDTDYLLSDYEFEFFAGLDPLYVAPEELQTVFLNVGLPEIAEQIFIASLDAKKLLSIKDDANPEDLPAIVLDYIRAAAACALTQVHGNTITDEISFRLGDLSVINKNFSKSSINRGNANGWCELAFALRKEMISTITTMIPALKAGAYRNPIPVRKLKKRRL